MFDPQKFAQLLYETNPNIDHKHAHALSWGDLQEPGKEAYREQARAVQERSALHDDDYNQQRLDALRKDMHAWVADFKLLQLSGKLEVLDLVRRGCLRAEARYNDLLMDMFPSHASLHGRGHGPPLRPPSR